MKKAILAISALSIVALALVSKGGQAKAAATEFQVKIDNFSFGPSDLTVPVGSTVTWINQDDVPHNVRSTDGKDIKSPVLDTDQKFTFTFSQAGTYAYYCSIHPKMTGKVVVQ